MMPVFTEFVEMSTSGFNEMYDITDDVAAIIADCSLKDGTVTVFVPGATGGVTTVEYEPGLRKDIPEAFEKIAPMGVDYHHDENWNDGNGFSHVRASLLGPSLVVPFIGKKLTLGAWQQIVFIDFDNRERHRKLVVQIMGE